MRAHVCVFDCIDFVLSMSKTVASSLPPSTRRYHNSTNNNILQTIQEEYPDYEIVICTGDADDGRILERCLGRFGSSSTPSSKRLRFVTIKSRWLVDAATWKRYVSYLLRLTHFTDSHTHKTTRFTLLGQSMGSILLGMEAFARMFTSLPDVYFDSMGYAFTYPFAKIVMGCKVGCYVHYPTISEDMFAKVVERRPTYNNDSRVTASITASKAKLLYYKAFAFMYGLVGRCADVVVVNSSWTKNHVDHIWGTRCKIVFPPCLSQLELDQAMKRADDVNKSTRDSSLIVSIGQFRPEKDHRLQLSAIRKTKGLLKASKDTQRVKLVLVGSCRDEEDRRRVVELREYATLKLDLIEGEDFEFRVGISRQEMIALLDTATIGLHTMWNEHFGIGIVEMMAAGVITIAHDSGGPKSDIVIDGQNGFLRSDDVGYAEAILRILNDRNLEQVRINALNSISRFTEESFSRGMIDAVREGLI